jgi:ATP-dependent Lon protease
MEIIRLEGYTEDEKLEIAKRHLLDKQIEAHGLKKGEFEAERRCAARSHPLLHARRACARWNARLPSWRAKCCVASLEGKAEGVAITPENLAEFSGVRKYRHGVGEEENQIGAVTGLAWTEVGGELLTIEAVTVPARGRSRPPASWAK